MSTIKSTLCLLAVLAAYGIAGQLDYEDAAMLEAAEREAKEGVSECGAPGDLAVRIGHRASQPVHGIRRPSPDPLMSHDATAFARPCFDTNP